MDLIDNRSRKSLDERTLREVFYGQLGAVALQTLIGCIIVRGLQI